MLVSPRKTRSAMAVSNTLAMVMPCSASKILASDAHACVTLEHFELCSQCRSDGASTEPSSSSNCGSVKTSKTAITSPTATCTELMTVAPRHRPGEYSKSTLKIGSFAVSICFRMRRSTSSEAWRESMTPRGITRPSSSAPRSRNRRASSSRAPMSLAASCSGLTTATSPSCEASASSCPLKRKASLSMAWLTAVMSAMWCLCRSSCLVLTSVTMAWTRFATRASLVAAQGSWPTSVSPRVIQPASVPRTLRA